MCVQVLSSDTNDISEMLDFNLNIQTNLKHSELVLPLPSPVSDIGAPLEKFRHTDEILTRQGGMHFYISTLPPNHSAITIWKLQDFHCKELDQLSWYKVNWIYRTNVELENKCRKQMQCVQLWRTQFLPTHTKLFHLHCLFALFFKLGQNFWPREGQWLIYLHTLPKELLCVFHNWRCRNFFHHKDTFVCFFLTPSDK